MLRSRLPSRSLIASLLLLAAGCGGDTTSPTEPVAPGGGPTADLIADATRNGGDPRFYWLAPIIKGATPSAGEFDPDAQPTVSVCVVAAATADAPCIGDPIATYDRSTGTGAQVVRVDAAEQSYAVLFQTNRFELDPAKTYRINVLLDGRRLGFADLELADRPGELKNVNTAEYVPLLDGRTLPVKFSIRKGLVVPPTAVADVYPASGAYTVGEAIVVDAANGVLVNDDRGTPAGTLDVPATRETELLGGTLTVRGDGGFSLLQTTRSGTASFTYTIRNSPTSSSTATVQIHVAAAPPVAVDDAAEGAASPTGVISLNVLANDAPGGPDVGVTFTDAPTTALGGTLTTSPDGTVTLTGATQPGSITLRYTLTNPAGQTSSAGVTFTIVGGTAPCRVVIESQELGRTDGQESPLTARVEDCAGNGLPNVPLTVQVLQGGTTITPAAPVSGTDGSVSLSWILVEGTNRVRVTAGTVSAERTVTGVLPPRAVDDAVQGRPGVLGVISLNVRTNDQTPILAFVSFDPAPTSVLGGTLTASQLDGTVTLRGATQLGSVTLTYLLVDIFGQRSDVATVTITVADGGAPCTVQLTAPSRDRVGSSATTVTARVTDCAGNPVTGAPLTVRVEGGSVLTATPFTLADGIGTILWNLGEGTNRITVSTAGGLVFARATVIGNAPPQAVNDEVGGLASPTLVLSRNVLTNDALGGPDVVLTFDPHPSSVLGGTLTTAANGTVTLTGPTQFGSYTLRYTLTNPFGETSSATVTFSTTTLSPGTP